ncbi:hypothetical protein Bpfe_012346 [Biomphalaria pfeifferi]|uniref:Uncharacterized protein n=1 Tax=Biomphalaria pfeifferi TaxID=112525 RepID=A0AAD8BPG0_BIOPF|nr:hypothetical protein Bpfe_012346 [Biomphalaria pfeifferi]
MASELNNEMEDQPEVVYSRHKLRAEFLVIFLMRSGPLTGRYDQTARPDLCRTSQRTLRSDSSSGLMSDISEDITIRQLVRTYVGHLRGHYGQRVRTYARTSQRTFRPFISQNI